MADCSYTRCIQERRIIKKHLQKWTKSCIYTLGFERVAEEFMGRRQWRLYQERVLKSWCPSIEQDLAVKDWDPTDDKCTFCDLEPIERESDEEAGSPLRADSETSTSTIKNNNNDSSNSNKNNIDLLGSDSSDSSGEEDRLTAMNTMDSSLSATLAALAAPHAGVNMPFYASDVFPRWFHSPPAPRIDPLAKKEPMVMNVPPTSQSATEMPLDLSAKSSKSPPAESPDNIRVPSTDPKQLFNADWSSNRSRPRMSPMSGRRTYTEDELQAALRDIQSGKLGTRRAAVIYGIPRSTLRNKVYKLALERERDTHPLLSAGSGQPPPPPAANSPSGADKEDSSAEEEKDQPALSMEDLLRLSAVDRGPGLAGYLAQLLKLKENVSPGDGERRLMKRIMDDEQKNGTEDDQSNVILRIPSFKPNTEPSAPSDQTISPGPQTPTDMQALIAKTISHKFQPEGNPPGLPTFHQMHHSPQQQRQNAAKGTRPKRGKYRNYDRDSLVEAVRAVQRGEMSVHRAGSYYGVPHSTLEYKVKERHLMRPRKREPKNDDKTKTLLSSGEKSKQQPIIAPKPQAQPPQKQFTPPNGLKFPPSLFDAGVSPLAAYGAAPPPPPFPFWPPNPFHGLPMPPGAEQLFAPPIPGLPPATRRIAESLYDGSGHNGSFLDGIIRSSLEVGLTPDKKSSEHLANKALMDQLCRNNNTQVPSDEKQVPFDLSRSSDDESDDRKRDDSMGEADDIDEDIDNISNHASDDDDPAVHDS